MAFYVLRNSLENVSFFEEYLGITAENTIVLGKSTGQKDHLQKSIATAAAEK